MSSDPELLLRSALRFPIPGPEHAELGPGDVRPSLQFELSDKRYQISDIRSVTYNGSVGSPHAATHPSISAPVGPGRVQRLAATRRVLKEVLPKDPGRPRPLPDASGPVGAMRALPRETPGAGRVSPQNPRSGLPTFSRNLSDTPSPFWRRVPNTSKHTRATSDSPGPREYSVHTTPTGKGI